jgi:hypothetical protein
VLRPWLWATSRSKPPSWAGRLVQPILDALFFGQQAPPGRTVAVGPVRSDLLEHLADQFWRSVASSGRPVNETCPSWKAILASSGRSRHLLSSAETELRIRGWGFESLRARFKSPGQRPTVEMA